jgi:hypothetical protein
VMGWCWWQGSGQAEETSAQGQRWALGWDWRCAWRWGLMACLVRMWAAWSLAVGMGWVLQQLPVQVAAFRVLQDWVTGMG